MRPFNIAIRAQSCSNGIVLCNFFLAVGEQHRNKRHAHSQWNEVSIESIDIFRVIYGSLWIILICTWSAASAHFKHVFLCVPHLFSASQCWTCQGIQSQHKPIWPAEWFVLFKRQPTTDVGCQIWGSVHISPSQDVFVDRGQHCLSEGSDSHGDWWSQ